MATASSLDQLFDPARGILTPQVAQRIVDWRPDEQLRERIEELSRKANVGTLSPEEDAEYREYIDDAEFISLMQAIAQRHFPRASG
jgi:hypothetical protein